MLLNSKLVGRLLDDDDHFSEYSTEKYPIGTIYMPENDPMHRAWVFCKNGGSGLTAGHLLTGPAPIADHTNIATGTAAAAGQKVVTVSTTLSTTLSDEQYHGGMLSINDADGQGRGYLIKSHDDTTTPVITLDENIAVALTASSEFSLVSNQYRGVIVRAGTVTQAVVGVAAVAATASYYFWAQVKGPCPVLTAGTLVIGNRATAASGGTAGSVAPATTTDITSAVIGDVLAVNASTEYSTINLKIDV